MTRHIQYCMNIPFIDRIVKPSLYYGWISGFSDAEGCFYGTVKICRTAKFSRAPHLMFQIYQKEF